MKIFCRHSKKYDTFEVLTPEGFVDFSLQFYFLLEVKVEKNIKRVVGWEYWINMS